MGSKKLTMESTLGEVYDTPIGHDVLKKVLLQLGAEDILITNPLVSKIPVSMIGKLTGHSMGQGFYETLINLCNSEKKAYKDTKHYYTPKWWKEAVFYQIYPRTFCDSNGDGVGDIQGIIKRLDYLKNLGVDALWLSPIYDSPNDDNGYDIRDYRKIMTEFGTMEDFEELLDKVHEKGMRLIMDLVVNHTSDEHEWFKDAISDKGSKYRDYYFIKENSDKAPNNWKSFFSGPAWGQYGEDELWALHLFSKKQVDLNWENAGLRRDIEDMIRFWLKKGVDGFRMDVINYISKGSLKDGDETIGKMFGFTGIEHYLYGPHLHEYLHELHEEAFAPFDAFSVGETPGVGMEMAKLLTGESREEIDMIFSFDHLETPGHERFDDYKYDLNYYRNYITDWMENYGNDCWMSLFYDNHDNPRMLSKVESDPRKQQAAARLLAVMQFTLRGTPFIFQGDEMGLKNYEFTSIEEITDVESKNKYAELCGSGMSEEKAFKTILSGTREHARVMIPWEDSAVSPHDPHRKVAMTQKADLDLTEVYKKLIALRKRYNALCYGEFKVLNKRRDRFTYERYDKNEKFVIDCNLSGTATRGAFDGSGFKLVYGPLYGRVEDEVLLPYEVRIWKK